MSGCFLAGLAEDGLFVLRRTFGQRYVLLVANVLLKAHLWSTLTCVFYLLVYT